MTPKKLTCLLLFSLLVTGCRSAKVPVDPQPGAILTAARVETDFALTGRATDSAWKRATPARMALSSRDGTPRPELATTVRALWSDKFLYLSFECPFTTLTVFEPVRQQERFGLWERDVVEAFIGADPKDIHRYTEYEVSPTNERVDVKLPEKDFQWSSGFESATHVDTNGHVWTAELRIPLRAMATAEPRRGDQWRINLYRCDYANRAFLAFNPTLTGTFHRPERFGVLAFR